MDLDPQPRNPHAFTQGNVLKVSLAYLRTFDLLHFSPDCQGYTELRHAPGAVGKPRMIPEFRALARASGVPYVIENVRAAAWDMVNPIELRGDMFNLGTQGCKLLRQRMFETSWGLKPPPVIRDTRPVVGVYGGHARRRAKSAGGRGTKDEWVGGHIAACSEAMGIDWMTLDELSNAIPPAYTRYIGEQFLASVTGDAA